MSKVITWVKANVFTVIFIVVMVAALVAIPLAAKAMNAGIRGDMQTRLAKKKSLEQLRRTSIDHTVPGTSFNVSGQGIVNEAFVNDFRELVAEEEEDAQHILETALSHNSKGRGVLLDTLFPDPPEWKREVLPGEFHERLVAAYDELLERVNAGQPPEADTIRADIDRKRRQFLTSRLQKEVTDVLTDDEQEKLTAYLTEERLALQQERADELSFYANVADLYVPEWQNVEYSMTELFEWQWDFWLIEDVLEALKSANGDGVVRVAPVKRVLTLVPDRAAPAAAGGSGGSSGGSSGGLGGSSPFGGGGGASGGGGPTMPIDATQPLNRDYSLSLTGRKTNGLYDVRTVQLELIVETTRLPEVLDALARRNFMTILNLEVRSADPYSAARAGYTYGTRPVSRVVIDLETVWMREWTAEFMPSETKQMFGVPAPPPPAGTDTQSG